MQKSAFIMLVISIKSIILQAMEESSLLRNLEQPSLGMVLANPQKSVCALCHQGNAQVYWLQQNVHTACAKRMLSAVQPVTTILQRHWREKRVHTWVEQLISGMNGAAQDIHGSFISLMDFYRHSGRKKFSIFCQTMGVLHIVELMTYKMGKLAERQCRYKRLLKEFAEDDTMTEKIKTKEIKLAKRYQTLSDTVKDLHGLCVSKSADIIGYASYAYYSIDEL